MTARLIYQMAIVLLFLISVLLVGCGDHSDTVEDEKPITFIELLKGEGASAANLGITKQLIVVNSQIEWDNLYSLYSLSAVPQLDFTQDLVIALQMGTHRSGGYSIRVDEIVEGKYSYAVYVVSHIPGSGCIVTDNLTSPYQFVKIPRTSKEVIFVESLTVDLCH